MYMSDNILDGERFFSELIYYIDKALNDYYQGGKGNSS